MREIRVGSDFSGVGAFDYAINRVAEQKGFKLKTVFACDWDHFARQSYTANHGTENDHELAKRKKQDQQSLAKEFSFYYPCDVYEREIPEESLDIYMTSPPCQAFSLAGKRKGKDDKRGILFFNSHEFIEKNKPRFFIFENVKGLLSDDGGKTFSEWINMLAGKSVNGNIQMFPYPDAVPYHVYWKVLNTKEHGVPQNRERVFIIGIRDDQDNDFQFPKEEPLQKKLKDVLEEFVDEKYFLSEEMVKNLIVYNERQIENNRGFSVKFRDPDSTEYMDALKCGGGGKDDLLKVKSATKQGFEIAKEVDSINFEQPNSKTRKGRVGKPVAQTLNTATHQGVMVADYRADEGLRIRKDGNAPCITSSIRHTDEFHPKAGTRNAPLVIQKESSNCVLVSKEVRSEQAKKNRKTTGTNDFRDKNIEFREQEHMNTVTTSLTNDHLIKNDYKIRRLTPRECFRLQDFPDSFKFVVSDSQLYKQAGNSITVRVLQKILEKLKL